MTWLDQLEQELDQRLASFLRSNPVQDQLFREQHQRDRVRALQRQRQQLTEEATEHRRQLLALAAEVKAWSDRIERARRAGAADLAQRADQHRGQLMEQGRKLWGDLTALGRRFDEVDRQLSDIKQHQKKPSTLSEDWALFEAEQELEELRRQAGLS